MAAFFLWCILLIICWPLALLAIVLFPIVWLITLPFRIVGIAVNGVFALLAALFFLPARVLRGPRGNLRVKKARNLPLLGYVRVRQRVRGCLDRPRRPVEISVETEKSCKMWGFQAPAKFAGILHGSQFNAIVYSYLRVVCSRQ